MNDSLPVPTLSALLRRPLVTVLQFSLAINLALLAPSIFMLQVFDRVMTTRSVETLLMLGLITAATLGLMGLLEYYRSRTLGALGILLEQRLGPVVLRHLALAASREPSRGGPENAMRDLATLRGFFAGQGVVALCDAPWTLVYLLLIYLFHPALGLLATACTLWLVLLGWLNERVTRGTIGELGDRTRDSARLIDAALRSGEAVAALGMAGAVTRRWQRRTGVSHALMLTLGQRAGLVTAATRLSRQLVQVLMLAYGAYLVVQDNATPGVMLATTIILGRALAPVEQLIGSWKTIVEARLAHARLGAVLAQPAVTVTTELPRPAGRLSVEGVSFVPPGSDRRLLHDVSFQVGPGQVLVLVGASGSGKTTLARLIVGALAPTTGAIRLDGSELSQWDPDRLGAWVGYLPQDVALFDATVSENIARLGEVDAEAVLEAAARAHAHEMLQRLPEGYETLVGDAGRRLSGGQRQRVALARALYRDPALVVLDEPDASLDADGEQALLEALRGLKSRGAAVIVVTQRRAVLSVADTVIVMKDGSIDRMANVEPPRSAVSGT